MLNCPVLVVEDFAAPSITLNLAARAFFGVTDEATHFKFKEHYKMLNRDDLEAGFVELAEGGATKVSALIADGSGEWHRCIISAQRLQSNGPNTLGATLTVEVQQGDEARATEITAWKKLQDLLWNAEDIGISVTDDVSSKPFLWNAALYRLLGIAKDSQAGSADVFLNYVHPLDRQKIQELLARLVSGQIDTWQGNYRIVDASGAVVWVNGRVLTAIDASGHRALASMVVSIDDARRATFEAAAAKLELEQFTYTLSHDLRAPVRHTESFVALLIENLGDRLTDEDRIYADYAQQSVRKLGTMIQGMVDYCRLPKTVKVMGEVDLESMVNEIVEKQFAQHRQRIRVACPVRLYGNRALLEKLFAHVISNAVKFSSKSPESEITVESQPLGDNCALISVIDHGVGFDPNYSEKLFSMFQRLHTAEEYKGQGIGLAIAKRIVELHGGEIDLVSEIGQGTHVKLALPLFQEREPRVDT